MKSSKQIRDEFIKYFQEKEHTFVPSSPVIPVNDPTLLFTNAGMNQFKDVFLGMGNRPYSRAVNSQKCIRVSGKHNDLEEVGRDTYHHTFFEMLGNWSFGDYYKTEAIQWAWELLTGIWKLPKEKLWATVYLDDDEAADIWVKETDVNPSQVLRFGEKDNFWEMGETGPCGPCSEIHIDLGPDFCDKKHLTNHTCQVNGDCARFIELWNLVFIQSNREEDGSLHPLPAKHVDTGMGFERIVAVIQGVHSNYDTDLFLPILAKIGELAGLKYETATETQQVAMRVIADHIRMLTFSISDGAVPSNEGRGYVLRRVLRRAARFGRKLGMYQPFIHNLVPAVVSIMGKAFPEIVAKREHVMNVIQSEEESFNKTLDRGIELFENLAQQLKSQQKKMIPGEEAFRLYDTYGFPLDLTRVMAEEQNLAIDEEGFDNEMEKQRERARSAGKFAAQFDHVDNWNVLQHCPSASHFVGYETLETETDICKFARKNGKYQVVLTETPFYAESGGQVADRGKLVSQDGELQVISVHKEGEEIIHVCETPQNFDIIHSRVTASVNPALRFPTMYNHTATHLLHAALRLVLGKHVQQAGSLVTPDRLRFDFTHFKKIEPRELAEIESIVNNQIRRDTPLEIYQTSYKKAQELGAMALFGEKYGEQVRVISIDDFSKELCGGTHVRRTGEIGSFVIVQESSIASGIRRVEALTGPAATSFLQQARDTLFEVGRILNSPVEGIASRVDSLTGQLREMEKNLQKMQGEQVLHQVDKAIENTELLGTVHLAIEKFENVDTDLLKQAADRFRQNVKNGVLLFINLSDGKINFVCAITDDLIRESGLKAGDLVREVAKITGGGGGGKAHLATAGGKHPEKLDEAIGYFRKHLLELTQ